MAEAAFKRSGKTTGVATGFIDLDKLLGGLHPSDLVDPGRAAVDGQDRARHQYRLQRRAQLTGRAGADGRTGAEDGAVVGLLLAGNVGRTARHPHPGRGIGRLLERTSARARCRHEDFDRFVQASQRLASVPFFIDDTPALSIAGAAHPRAAAQAPAGAGPDRRRLSAAASAAAGSGGRRTGCRKSPRSPAGSRRWPRN